MKKGVDFVWDAECEAAFQDIKSYLTKPPVLAVPTTGKPFILYTRALDYSLGALLAQENDGGKEAAPYYLSRMLVGAEHRYSPVKKECLAVMFILQKLHHYLLSNTVYLISNCDRRMDHFASRALREPAFVTRTFKRLILEIR